MPAASPGPWITTRCTYKELANKLNDLERDGYSIEKVTATDSPGAPILIVARRRRRYTTRVHNTQKDTR